jgi:hypothetical protein
VSSFWQPEAIERVGILLDAGVAARAADTQATLYAADDGVSFTVAGTRFRKDGTLGKRYDTFYLRFEDEKPGAGG